MKNIHTYNVQNLNKMYQRRQIHFVIEKNFSLPVRIPCTYVWLRSFLTLVLNLLKLLRKVVSFSNLIKLGTFQKGKKRRKTYI